MSIQKTSIDFGLSIQIEKIFQGSSLEKYSIEKGIAMIFSGGCGTYFGKPGGNYRLPFQLLYPHIRDVLLLFLRVTKSEDKKILNNLCFFIG